MGQAAGDIWKVLALKPWILMSERPRFEIPPTPALGVEANYLRSLGLKFLIHKMEIIMAKAVIHSNTIQTKILLPWWKSESKRQCGLWKKLKLLSLWHQPNMFKHSTEDTRKGEATWGVRNSHTLIAFLFSHGSSTCCNANLDLTDYTSPRSER